MSAKARSATSLGSGVITLSGSKFLTLLIGTVSSMLMARLRTKTDYGTYTALLMSIRTLSVFLMMGLPNAINYFLAKSDTQEEKQRFLSVYYTFSTILSVLIGLSLFLALPWVVQFFGNPDLEHYAFFLLLCPWVYIISGSGATDHLLIAYRRTKTLAIMRVANSVALLGIIPLAELCSSFLDKSAFYIYVVLYLVAEGAFSLISYVFASRAAGGLRPSLDWKKLREVLSFSLPIGLAASVSTLNGEIDKLFVGAMHDPASLAVYDYGSRSLPFYVIPVAITSVLTPLIVRMVKEKKSEEAVFLWGRVVEFSFGILFFAAGVLMVFAPQVVTILYSEKYIDCVPIFIIFRVALIMQVTYFGMILNALGRTKFIFLSSCCSLLANILLNSFFFFCTDLGFVGLALSTILSSLCMNLTQLLATCRLIHVPFSKIMPWKKLLKTALVACAILLPAGALLKGLGFFFPALFSESAPLSLVLAVVLGVICSLLYLFLLRRYIKELWHFINSYKMADASKDTAPADAVPSAE